MVEEGKDEVAKSTFYELFIPGVTSEEDLNQASIRDVVRDIAQLVYITSPGTPIRETKRFENNFHLAPGDHMGAVLEKVNTKIVGIPGAKFSKTLAIDAQATAQITNMRFEENVELGSRATGIFTDCVFEKLVNMTNGSLAHFIGCVFLDEAAVNNAGAGGNAYIIGCSRKSGVAHTNVTTIAETT